MIAVPKVGKVLGQQTLCNLLFNSIVCVHTEPMYLQTKDIYIYIWKKKIWKEGINKEKKKGNSMSLSKGTRMLPLAESLVQEISLIPSTYANGKI